MSAAKGTAPALMTDRNAQWDVAEFPVSGIKCDGCATTIRLGLTGVAGVQAVDVDVRRGAVTVTRDPGVVDEAGLHNAIEELGYRVKTPDGDGAGSGSSRNPLVAAAVLGVPLIVGTVAFAFLSARFFRSGGVQAFNDSLGQASVLAVLLALGFGLVAGFAPSTYAMAPALVGYVARSHDASPSRGARLSLAFVAGIVTVDVVIGALLGISGTAVLRFLGGRLPLWYLVATTVLGLLALINLRLLRLPRLPNLVPSGTRGGGTGGAFILGVPFGFLTCPACTPLLLPVALAAVTAGNPVYGAALMGSFAVGRGLPLIAIGTSMTKIDALRHLDHFVPWVEKVVGLLLLLGAAYFLRQFISVGGFGNL